MEHSVLAGQVVGMILLGELNAQVALLADVHAHHLLFKAGDEHARADRQGLTLRGAALKGDAIHAAGVVQVYDIAVFNGAVGHILGGARALHIVLDAGVHGLVGHFFHVLFNGYALVFAQRHVGLYEYLQGILQLLTGADLLHIYLGTIHNLKVFSLDGLFVGGLGDKLEGVVIEHPFAVHILNQLAGGLALAEAGDGDRAAALQIGLFDGRVKGLSALHKRELHFIARDFFDGIRHVEPSCANLRINPCAAR